jgi:hypothetical protein
VPSSGTSNLARTALALMLVAGCSPRPITLPPSTILPTPTQAVPAPIPLASAAVGLNVGWTTFPRLPDMNRMVHGPAGWIVLRGCREYLCPELTGWHSHDLDVWEEIALPMSGDVIPISLSANGDSYLVSASDYDDVGEYGETFTQVWRSSDGRTWQRVGEMLSGECNIAGCPHPTGVGLAPNGSIFVGAIEPRDGDPTGPFLSEDGVRWGDTVVAEALVANEFVHIESVQSTPTDLFVLGDVCRHQGDGLTCTTSVWSTADGEQWVEEHSFGGEKDRGAIATDGAIRVGALLNCDYGTFPLECTTEVWSGLRGMPWAIVAPDLDVAASDVAWTGEAFVLVGVRDGRFVTYVSRDGSSWEGVETDALGGMGDCGAGGLTAGAGRVVFLTSCGAWRGRVQPAG